MNRIRLLREEFGFTQQDLADKINGAKSTVAMYENGTRNPSMEILIRLSEIFNCSIDYILNKSDIRNFNEINKELINIGLNQNDYSPLTIEQKEKIEEFAKFVLRDNLKKNGEK